MVSRQSTAKDADKRPKINIAHLVHSFNMGGIENGIVNLANNLNRDRYNHLIVSFTDIGDFQSRISFNNTRVVTINKEPGNDLKAILRLAKLFKQHEIHIVHARGWATMLEGIVSSKLARVPVVVYGFPGKTYEDSLGEPIARIIIQVLLLKAVDGVVTYIQDMKNDMHINLKVPERKIKLIKNGVDLSQFTLDQNCMKKELNIAENEFVIGAIGRFDRVKNYSTLIKAFLLFAKTHDRLKLVMVGDGDEYDSLKKEILESGHADQISLLGKRNDIAALLNCFDVFVQPSFYEGLSNTILEAMAMGLPIIASNVGGNRDIIHHGSNGLLFHPDDVHGLTSSLEEIYKNNGLREHMGKLNRKTVLHEFSLSEMVKHYDHYYRSLLTVP